MEYSILMPGTVVKAGASISYAIVAEDAVEAGAVVGASGRFSRLGHRRSGRRRHRGREGHRDAQRHGPGRCERR